jgi:hypothetical protein
VLAIRLSRLKQGRQEDRADGFLNRLKRRPAVWDNVLQVLPLLLEGLGKDGVGGLEFENDSSENGDASSYSSSSSTSLKNVVSPFALCYKADESADESKK